jgi:23S rRNA pseudouridine2605 synthase
MSPMNRKSQPTRREERLQKILSHAGLSSRRAAEEMILSGRVAVNGHTIRELGTKADPTRDRITVDGRPLAAEARPIYLALHKPAGVMTTLSDPEGRPTVRDLLAGVRERVYPVGRLDFNSAGLLLFTNDGELAMRLTHPRYGVRKIYRVKVRGTPDEAQRRRLAQGIRLEEGTTAPAAVRVVESSPTKSWIEVTIAEGKKRQVRRMCEAVGLQVEKLVRIAFGPLKLGKLPPGAWRPLTEVELVKLRRELGWGEGREARSELANQRRGAGRGPRRGTREGGERRGAGGSRGRRG